MANVMESVSVKSCQIQQRPGDQPPPDNLFLTLSLEFATCHQQLLKKSIERLIRLPRKLLLKASGSLVMVRSSGNRPFLTNQGKEEKHLLRQGNLLKRVTLDCRVVGYIKNYVRRFWQVRSVMNNSGDFLPYAVVSTVKTIAALLRNPEG